MKYLLIILLFTYSVGKANVRDTVPGSNVPPQLFGGKLYEFLNYMVTDSFIMVKTGDTFAIPRWPAIKYKTSDSRWYGYYPGYRWRAFLNGLDTVSLSNRIDNAGDNFANTDLTLTGNRNHQLGNYYVRINKGTDPTFRIDPTNGAYQLGKATFNGSYLSLDTTSGITLLQAANAHYFEMNAPNNRTHLVMQSGFNFLDLDAGNGTYQMGDISSSGSGNNTYLNIDDANSRFTLNTGGARKALLAPSGQWTWDGYSALSAQSDTDVYKPVAMNSSGAVVKMVGWSGGISNVLKIRDSVFVNSYSQSNYSFRDSVRWGIFSDTVANSIPGNIRNDANSVIRLTNGRLICAYTAFGAASGDADSAIIVTKISDDNGATWTNLDTAVQVSANGNYVPSLYFNPGGDTLRLLYLRANGTITNQMYSTYCTNFTNSNMTWSAPVLAFGSGSEYYSPGSDRVFRSKKGIYFYPLTVHIDGELSSGTGRYDGYLMRSFGGLVWDTVPGVRIISPDTLFVEGGLIQTDDAFSLITYYGRTRSGQLYMSQSTDDDAVSFGSVYPWGLWCNNSTTTVKYLEESKTLIAIHNRYVGAGQINGTQGRRILDMSIRKIAPPNINLAILPDAFSGQWQFLYRIDSLTNKQFIEPSITFSSNEILVTYSGGDFSTGDTFTLQTKKLPYYMVTNTSNRDAQQLVLNKTFNGNDANFLEMYSNGLSTTNAYFKIRNQTAGNTNFGGWIDVKGFGAISANPLYITPHGNCNDGGVWIDADNGSGSINNGAIVFRATNFGSERFRVFGDGSLRFNNSGGETGHLFGSTGNWLLGTSGTDNTIGKLQVEGKITVSTHAIASNSDSALIWDRSTTEYKIAKINAISSINSMTGPAITVTSGTGLTTSSGSNTVTVSYDVNSTDVHNVLNKTYIDANNSGTSETDLYSYTLPANKLINNGASVHMAYTGTNNDATATTQIQGYFAGNNVYNSTALTLSGVGDWRIDIDVTRATSTTARVSVKFSMDNATVTLPVKYTALTGLDFTTTNIFKVTGTAGGGTGGSNDITGTVGKIIFEP